MRAVAIAVFVIALCALALLTSTNVVTLFKGSHTITSLTSNENDVSCISCHSRIAAELQNSSVHSNFKCEECHRLRQTAEGRTVEYATHNVSGVHPGRQAHAAYTPRCLDCHGGDGYYINDTGVLKHAPPAYPFNETNYGSNYSAHKSLVLKARELNISVGENEACLACHTNYSIGISYTYFWNISYSMSSWRFTSFAYNGTRKYGCTYTKSGAKHEFINTSGIDCTKCHKNIYDALVYGTNGTNENYLTHAPIEIHSGTNGWGTDNKCWNHNRYHYISAAYRATGVNTEYCIECHNVARYAKENPSSASYYSLSSVVDDTNSTKVHAAESLTCATCHEYGKTKWPSCADHEYPNNFTRYIENNYARTFQGDICMSCHEAAVHPDSGSCGNCHGQGGVVHDAYVESEPSGLVCNSEGTTCPSGPTAYFTYTPLHPTPGESVEFDASGSSGDIVSYEWEFGDGNTTTTTNPIIYHTYTSEGNYTVNLTVTDSLGFKDTYSDVVSVSAAAKQWVYQETADSITCGGTWFLSQPCSNTYDGDWNTYGMASSGKTAYVVLTYNKPAGATDAVWKVKDQSGTRNVTIPDTCWNYYADKIVLKAESDKSNAWYPKTHWYCYDGSWNEISTDNSNANVYEEGIWWYK